MKGEKKKAIHTEKPSRLLAGKKNQLERGISVNESFLSAEEEVLMKMA